MSETEQVDRREDSLSAAVLAGFVATGLMTVVLSLAYAVAFTFGSPSPQAPALLRWMWGLTNNTLTARTQTAVPVAVGLHFVSGIATAVVYSLVEPRLRGPGWRRGMVFSLVPWMLSLVVFLPAVGGGPLGLRLGAGPLPILGNLVLHLVYGATLGQLYGPRGGRLQSETGQPEDASDALILSRDQRAIALGIVVGLVLGGAVGWLGHLLLGLGTRPLVALVLGAIAGSTAGAFVGSFLGLSPGEPRR
ncbi:MAG: DUF6789 family protein [Pseudonocardiaceae bacterium]